MNRRASHDNFLQPPPDPHRFHQQPEAEEQRSVGRALGAALALLVLLVGIPVGLWALAGPPPLPDSWPSRQDLTEPIGVDALLSVLLAVVWLAWLHFVLCVLAEMVSTLRGRGLPAAVPFGGFSQRLARVLVGALLVTGVAAGTATAGPSPAPEPGGTVPGVTVTTVAADQATNTDRWDDPTTVTRNDNPLAGKKVYVVKAPRGHYHDNLWDIAEKHLGDGRRYKEIYELNKGRIQPDGQGLELARLIQPGWNLILPEDATGVERVPETTVETRQGGGGEQSGKTDAGGGSKVETGGGTQSGGGTKVETGGGTAGGETRTDDAGAGQVQQDPRWRLPSDLLGGGMMSAGILILLLLERRRRRGKDPTPAASAAEVALLVGADSDRAAWLDRALRDLTFLCEQANVPLPPVVATTVSDQAIELMLAPARTDAPAPWTARRNGHVWRLERGPDGPGRGGPAPYPALVCLGRDESGQDVLVDLEAAGSAVCVDGDPVIAREIATAVAVQLATAPWADQLQVTASALPGDLEDILPDRLRLVDSVDEIVPDLERAVGGAAELDVIAGRISRDADARREYLVLGAPPTVDTADRLTALAAHGRSGFGMFAAGSVAGSRWPLRVDETGTLQIPALGMSVTAVRLSEQSLGVVDDLLASARSERPDDGRRPRLPDSGRRGDDSAWVTAPVRVGVLGPVEVRSGAELDPARLELATEIVTFLALHPGGVHPSVLGASVWPRGVTAEVRDSSVGRVRDWLGTDSAGNHRLQVDPGGRLSLGPEIAIDWDCVCELLRRSRTARTVREERELLRRALHLVRGEFLSGRPKGHYSWIARVHLERLVPDVVTDAAHRLAELSFGDDDPAGAADAARAGLRLAPGAELLWRDLLSAEHRRGGTAAAEQVVGALGEAAQHRGVTVSAETDALIQELLPTPARRHGRVG